MKQKLQTLLETYPFFDIYVQIQYKAFSENTWTMPEKLSFEKLEKYENNSIKKLKVKIVKYYELT